MSRGTVLVLALGGALVACGGEPRPLTWEVSFAVGATADDARALEAEIREGGCGGDALYAATVAVDGEPASMSPPDLEPGTYGFAVAAITADCRRYAEGCVEVTLPQAEPAPLRVSLSPIPAEAVCEASACDDGFCAGMDGGTPREDAGRRDAGTRDGGGVDAGPLGCDEGTANCNFDPGDGCEVSLGTDTDCTACGDVCRLPHASASCGSGTCEIVACDDGWADCDVLDATGCEVSLRTLTDCGGCGTACSLPHAVEQCNAGACELVGCHAGYEDCDGVVANGCEVSLRTSTDCGACGMACEGLTPLCALDGTGPRCVDLCPSDTPTACGNVCVNTATDPRYCGGCATECAVANAAAACVAGICQVGTCDPAFANCDASVANGCERSLTTSTDCGACNTTCTSTTGELSCVTGSCQVDECFGERGDCDGSASNGCETDLTLPSSCGACEAACAGGTPLCGVSGGETQCLAACEAPRPDACESRCYDTDADMANCGGCGLSCALPGASEACYGGACRIVACDLGLASCDGDDDNGCETTVASSLLHCGTCGNACPMPANATATCSGGTCGFVCMGGFGDCDGMPENGCEQPLDTLTDCGACGRACAPPNATGTCDTGSCQVTTCTAGFLDCDFSPTTGCEVDSRIDPMNCGTCGMRCTGGGGRDCCGGICGTC